MVTARFAVLRADGSRLDEDAIARDPPGPRAADDEPDAFDGAEGRLFIEHGGVTTDMGDTLGLLIGRFCLGGLARLRQDGRLSIDFMDHEESVEITVAGGTVTLGGERFGTMSYPATDYLDAMAACGARYVALARRLWRDDPERRERLAQLEAQLAGLA